MHLSRLSSALNSYHAVHRLPVKVSLRALSISPICLHASSPHILSKTQKRSFATLPYSEQEKKSGLPLINLYLASLGLATLGLAAFISSSPKKETPFIENISRELYRIIDHTEEIPGLGALQSKELAVLRPKLVQTWNALVENGVLEISGVDKEIRPLFVGLQAIIEHVLASQMPEKVTSFDGFIHTPMPATPLCSKRAPISDSLAKASIQNDPSRLATVHARTHTIRSILENNGKLIIAYPESGYSKRSEKEQAIYREELMKYGDQLSDMPLNCSSIPEELIGATYSFKDNLKEETFVFAIKITQANDPKDAGHFAIWFGPLKENKAIQKRVNEVALFVNSNHPTPSLKNGLSND